MHAVRASRLAWMSVRMAVRIGAALTTPRTSRLQAGPPLLLRRLGLAEDLIGIETGAAHGLVVRIAGAGNAPIGLETPHRGRGLAVDFTSVCLAHVEIALGG